MHSLFAALLSLMAYGSVESFLPLLVLVVYESIVHSSHAKLYTSSVCLLVYCGAVLVLLLLACIIVDDGVVPTAPSSLYITLSTLVGTLTLLIQQSSFALFDLGYLYPYSTASALLLTAHHLYLVHMYLVLAMSLPLLLVIYSQK